MGLTAPAAKLRIARQPEMDMNDFDSLRRGAHCGRSLASAPFRLEEHGCAAAVRPATEVERRC